ncbi:MAG: phage Gp37/Gp68 family protein [Gammaproteobacteria bacterium]|nr:phage Gp37/Gp68 family protein [Gammaproteobacteria bacterium]MCP5135430.1 phage Gp37/Gp68 family protein [Gammaproteobacteria bacterium]
MGTESKIEWTERTWNPTTGCTKVSPGCKHCYAEVMARRLQAMGAPGYGNGFNLTLLAKRLDEPRQRKKATVYFVNSMSDLFHEDVPDSFLDQVFKVITETPQHTYQILTKRAERMAEYFSTRKAPVNVWLGVSVENRKHGLPRIDALRTVDAAIRFLSVEPLLEDLGRLDLNGIDWVIVGGESGPKARPMHEEWALNVQRQCDRDHVLFFFKQWGGWGADGKRRAKSKNGRLLSGRTWDDMPKLGAQASLL